MSLPQHQTRRFRAQDLLARVLEGPSFSSSIPPEAAAQYRLWASTWIAPELCRLVKELEEAKFNPCSSQPQRPTFDVPKTPLRK